MASKNDKKMRAFTVRFPSQQIDILNLHAKKHRLNGIAEALRNILKDYVIIKPEHEKMRADWEKYKTMLTQNSNSEKSQPSNGEISEKPCSMMIYIEKRAMCGDPQAPISGFMKSHLNAQVCALCRKLRKKQLEHDKKIDEVNRKLREKEIKKFHEQTKKRVHSGQERINRRLRQENASGVPFSQSCPKGESPSWCYNNPCDKRPECKAKHIIS